MSVLLVAVVIWLMWRLPVKDGSAGWTPAVALLSPWAGLAAVLGSAGLWGLPYPDRWLPVLLFGLDPVAIGSGTLVLWAHRGDANPVESVVQQRQQANVGIGLGLAASALGYIFVMTHKTPFTAIGS